jgi:hypothetical protein
LERLARAQDAVRVEEYVKGARVESLIELRRDAACLNPTVTNKETASLSQKTEALQDPAGETLEVGTAILEGNTIKESNLWRH